MMACSQAAAGLPPAKAGIPPEEAAGVWTVITPHTCVVLCRTHPSTYLSLRLAVFSGLARQEFSVLFYT